MIELALDAPTAAVAEREPAPLRTIGTDRVRMILIDPDPLSRHALSDGLRADGRFTVIAQAESTTEGVELALHYRPALVVIANAVPGGEAVEATRRIAAAGAGARVVLLSAARALELEMSAVRAGASGFVDKGAGAPAIAHALAAVAAGESVISREMTRHLVDRLRATPKDGYGIRPVKSPLTDREWEILDLICAGSSTREMADSLFLSTETVNSHVKRILRKLGVHSRSEAVEAAGRMRSTILV
ncbi:MAG TPA: response regulator transcription factor [Solirubrobacteraceae bacterium]|nr:response regulator transcription factor [Solirubrobacteraceae bacterium]